MLVKFPATLAEGMAFSDQYICSLPLPMPLFNHDLRTLVESPQAHHPSPDTNYSEPRIYPLNLRLSSILPSTSRVVALLLPNVALSTFHNPLRNLRSPLPIWHDHEAWSRYFTFSGNPLLLTSNLGGLTITRDISRLLDGHSSIRYRTACLICCRPSNSQ
jgi:hypothetical protein